MFPIGSNFLITAPSLARFVLADGRSQPSQIARITHLRSLRFAVEVQRVNLNDAARLNMNILLDEEE